ncbi:hypothetical protein Glove_92g92 [Diversispora epigaea]|uniref:Helitron helicase-like domain-containing protein n=1 Tax=Diversispora epigaea TaxID=1348612 RepID=A0A397JET7_9GLOM|nr:hypothetical protein Glove_92g92 [Diversispora epigaea]
MPYSNVSRNEYTDLSLLLAAFPTLFPYGVGDHENNFHKCYILFKQYVKHLLQVHDSKMTHFEANKVKLTLVLALTREKLQVITDNWENQKATAMEYSWVTLPDIIIGLVPNSFVLACRKLTGDSVLGAKVVTKNITVIEQEVVFDDITGALLYDSSAMDTPVNRKQYSYSINKVSLNATITPVQGATMSRADSLPSLFITINPADFHSSIVMMYAEKKINVNTLLPEDFSTATERVKLAHLNPIAITKYFNIVIEKMIKFIIGYKKSKGEVFGEIKNYYAVTEYQDHGTPHYHMLIWLHGYILP